MLQRDAIRYLTDLVDYDLITHVFILVLNRLARSTKSDTLGLVGLLADHDITIVTKNKILRAADPGDRKQIIDDIFIGERESAEKSVAITTNLDTYFQHGYDHGTASFGMKRRLEKGHIKFEYHKHARRTIRTIHREFLRRVQRRKGDITRFVEYANQRLRTKWSGKYSRKKIYRILTNPTYEGTRIRKSMQRQDSHLQISGLQRPQVRQRLESISRNAGQIPPKAYSRVNLETLLERSAASLLLLQENRNLVILCRRPGCHRKAMELIQHDQRAAVQNGGRVIRGVWLQLYRCQVCRRSFFVILPRHLRLMMDGCRCMRCGLLNQFTIKPEDRATKWGNLVRATCRCGASVLLERSRWEMQFPFAKDFRRLLVESRKRPKWEHCVHANARICGGRCKKAAALLAKGEFAYEVGPKVGLAVTTVQALRRRLRIKRHKVSLFVHHEAIQRYHHGDNDRKLARRFNVSQDLIRAWRRKLGLPARRRTPKVKDADALRVYRRTKGEGDAQMARRLGLRTSTFTGWRKRRGLPSKLKKHKIDVETIRRLIREGKSNKQMARALRVTPSAVANWKRLKGRR